MSDFVMTCGCRFDYVVWDERAIGEACGCSSCVDCGLINTQEPNPQDWRCYPDHPLSCGKELGA